MGGNAWVTLATNDSYSLGALVLAHSLKQVGTQQQLAVLITPGVTGPMRSKLSEVFNVVVEVNLLDSKDETNLRLLKRPELGVTFTKLHCWRLTQFDKCVFLDADTLVLENCDELFDREELSAAPDIGWPDCFNSGVFVFRPSMETHEKLIQFALEKGSFDGGDQGLLNLYFSDWAHKDISKHLPFIYNMASTACYSYLPAFKQFGKSAKIIHFIGASKPWLQYFDTETRRVHPAEGVKHLQDILQLWWNIFCNLIHPGLSPEMTSHTDTVHGSQSSTYQSPSQNCPSPNASYPAEVYQKVWDPWEEYDSIQQNNQSRNQIRHETDISHKYQIPETRSNSLHDQYINNEKPHNHHTTESHDLQGHHVDHQNIQNELVKHHNSRSQPVEHQNIQNDPVGYDNSQSHHVGHHNNQSHPVQHHNNQNHPVEYHNIQSYPIEHHIIQADPVKDHNTQSHPFPHHDIQNHHFEHHNPQRNAAVSHEIQFHSGQEEHIESHNTNACIEADNHYHDHSNPVYSQPQTPVIVPVQQHLFSTDQPPPNDPPNPNLPDECMATTTVSNEMTLQTDSKEDSNENNAGLAGAFAQLTLGSPRTAEQQALDDHLRRQGWEVGNIDYMGRDSFQNIWNKICQTLSLAPEQTTTIKETTPPKAGSKPSEDLPVEVKSDERSVEVASSEVQPIKEVVEAEPVEILSTGVPQEDPIETPVTGTPESCNKITLTGKIEQAEAITTTDTVESKTEAQATEFILAPARDVEVPQQSKTTPAQNQVETPTAAQHSAVSTELGVSPEAEIQPVAKKPALEMSAAPVTMSPPASSAQEPEVPAAKVPESFLVQPPKVPVAPVPEPAPVQPSEVPVAPVPEPSPIQPPKVPVAPVPEPAPVQPSEVPVAPVPEPSPIQPREVPVAPVPEPSPVQPPEVPVAPIAEPSPVQPPEAPVPEPSPVQPPEVSAAKVPESSPAKPPEVPAVPVAEPSPVQAPEIPPVAPAPEPSQPSPVQPPPSPADPLPSTKCPTSVTAVISDCEPSKRSTVQPSTTLESAAVTTVREKSQPTPEQPSILTANVESAAVDSPTMVPGSPKLATQPHIPSSKQPNKSPPFVTCPMKKPSGKLNVTATVKEPAEQELALATPQVSSALAPKLQAEVATPSPPTTPVSPQPEQMTVAKEALKVETTVPATPPPDTQQTPSGPTPPPRKSSGGTKKATKPKK